MTVQSCRPVFETACGALNYISENKGLRGSLTSVYPLSPGRDYYWHKQQRSIHRVHTTKTGSFAPGPTLAGTMTLSFRPISTSELLSVWVRSASSQSSPSSIVNSPVPIVLNKASSVSWGSPFRTEGPLACWGHERPYVVALWLPVYGPSGSGRRKRRFPTLTIWRFS